MCRYPGPRASFHACYYDLREMVDYNYLSVPIKACEVLEQLKGLSSVDVWLWDEQGRATETKRTLPVVQTPSSTFPPRFLLLRAVVDACLAGQDDPTTCIASWSAAS